MTGILFKISTPAVKNILNNIANSGKLAPQIIPTLIAQNRNIKSIGSFIAVLNLTMDNAPTIPNEITIFDCIVKIIADVITATHAKDILKFLE